MTSDPTAEQLAELVALAEAATPGPWVEQHDEPIERTGFYVDSHASEDGPQPVVPPINSGYSASWADAAYIAAANPAVIGPLARDVSQLRDRVAELTAIEARAEQLLTGLVQMHMFIKLHCESTGATSIPVDRVFDLIEEIMTPELVAEQRAIAAARAALPEIPS